MPDSSDISKLAAEQGTTPLVLSMLLRHIDEQGEVLNRRLDAQDDVMDEIRAHVSLTNGHIADAKREIAENAKEIGEIKIWRARFEGAKAAVSWIPPLLYAAIGSGAGALVAVLLVK